MFVPKIRFKLAVPNTVEENDFIEYHIASDSWIGITDKSSEDTFRGNFNDQIIGWANWDSGQPDNGNWFLGTGFLGKGIIN